MIIIGLWCKIYKYRGGDHEIKVCYIFVSIHYCGGVSYAWLCVAQGLWKGPIIH